MNDLVRSPGDRNEWERRTSAVVRRVSSLTQDEFDAYTRARPDSLPYLRRLALSAPADDRDAQALLRKMRHE